MLCNNLTIKNLCKTTCIYFHIVIIIISVLDTSDVRWVQVVAMPVVYYLPVVVLKSHQVPAS